ncbi:hypothetical protein NQD34_004156, partial [Periophthalmus magnuspinnatus]
WICSLCRPDQDLDQDLDQELFGVVPYALSSQDQRRCEKLTLLLLTHKLSSPFHRPVSPQFRHYYQIVRRPIDLSLIRRKLQTTPPRHTPSPTALNPPPPALTPPPASPLTILTPPATPPPAGLKYLSPEQFVDDILLMFHNCATFNYPDSEVTEAGLKLKVFFLLKLKEVFPERTFPLTNQS